MREYFTEADMLVQQLTKEMFGMDEVVKLCLVALFSDGHVLLEGNPGLGKTALVKSFENVMGFQFGRIQFTPDLMPADITGTLMPSTDGSGKLMFKRGPIFTSLLLADEINRATPKTQAAMLEAMAERSVTVLGETYSLNDDESFRVFKDDSGSVTLRSNRPFIVLATQNPIEHEGTYELPEAQSDRFMFKILMPTPNEDTLLRILSKTSGTLATQEKNGSTNLKAGSRFTLQQRHDMSVELYKNLKEDIKAVQPLPSVQKHIANLFLATNGKADAIDSVNGKARERLKQLHGQLQFGLGPRSAIDLMKAAKAWTKLFIPDVTSADGRALAQVVLPVLRHRTHLTYEGRSAHQLSAGVNRDRVTDHFLRDLCTESAPDIGTLHQSYRKTFASALDQMISERGC